MCPGSGKTRLMYNLCVLLHLQAKSPDLQTSRVAMFWPIRQRRRRTAKRFLHAIFSPLSPAEVKEAVERLRIPAAFAAFLRQQNGANLFADSVRVLGVVPANLPILRAGSARNPLSLEERNAKANLSINQEWMQIGVYRERKAQVWLSRNDGQVRLMSATRGQAVIQEWSSFDEWLKQELRRFEKEFGKKNDAQVPAPFTGSRREVNLDAQRIRRPEELTGASVVLELYRSSRSILRYSGA